MQNIEMIKFIAYGSRSKDFQHYLLNIIVKVAHSGAKFFKINQNYFRRRSRSYHGDGHCKNNVLVQSTKLYVGSLKENI